MQDNSMDEEFFSDALLKQAAALAGKAFFDDIVIPEEEHVFSKRFERKMKRLIKYARKKEANPSLSYSSFTRRRVALCITLAIILSLFFAVTVSAANGSLFNMIEKVFPKYSIVTYQPGEDLTGGALSSIADKPFVEYELTYVPDGYTLTEESVVPELKEKTLYFDNISGNCISFNQFPIEKTDFMLNTEGTTLESFSLDETEFHYCSNLGMQMLFWDNGEYVFLISSELDKETVIKLAQSTKIKEK